jgi:hypothetical protein
MPLRSLCRPSATGVYPDRVGAVSLSLLPCFSSL